MVWCHQASNWYNSVIHSCRDNFNPALGKKPANYPHAGPSQELRIYQMPEKNQQRGNMCLPCTPVISRHTICH